MPKTPSIATTQQQDHARIVLANLEQKSGMSRSAFSTHLIGTTILLDFHNGAELTKTLLSRILIGFRAIGNPLTQDELLGPDKSVIVGHKEPSEMSESSERHLYAAEDNIGYCLDCLTRQLNELCAVSAQLTKIFSAIVTMCVEQNALPLKPQQILPYIKRDTAIQSLKE